MAVTKDWLYEMNNIFDKNEDEYIEEFDKFCSELKNEEESLDLTKSTKQPEWEEADDNNDPSIFLEQEGNINALANHSISVVIDQLVDIEWPKRALRKAERRSLNENITYEKDNRMTDAIRNGNLAHVKRLLSGQDVNTADAEGLTPLHWATIEGKKAIAEYLLNNGADIHVKDTNGLTPLHYAAKCRHLEMVQLLVSWSANCLLECHEGRLPIDLTQDEKIKKLLKT